MSTPRNSARSTDVVVIGGGQAGLAMSRCLTDRSIDHVVLERAEVANSWTTERWDSLRLLTPNWMSRLPGASYQGSDPDGYMTAREVATFLDAYRRSFDAPVHTGVSVTRIAHTDRRSRGRGEQRPLARAGRRDGDRRMQQPPRPGHQRRASRLHRPGHTDRLPQSGSAGCRTASSWSGRRRQACRSRTSSLGPAAR